MYSCANVTPLTGGAKDTYAPVLDQGRTTPAPGSVNFNSSQITLQFDEYIKLNNAEQCLQVNPKLKSPPSILVKEKSILISLNEELQPDKTYTFSFNNCISDYTEGNTIKNFNYVVATGNHIDSLEYSGYVYDAKSGLPMDNALVGLYSNTESDSSILTVEPIYTSFTSSDGRFAFQNLSSEEFKILAMTDENANYKYDKTEESIGFEMNNIMPIYEDTLPGRVDIFMFNEKDSSLQLLSKTGFKEGKACLAFNNGIGPNELIFNPKPITINYNFTKDSIEVVFEKGVNKAQLIARLNGKTAFDTISIPLTTETIKPSPLNKSNVFKLGDPIIVELNCFLDTFDLTKVTIAKDTVNIEFEADLSQDRTRLFFEIPEIREGAYHIVFEKGALSGFGNSINDSILCNIEIRPKTDFGSIELEVDSITKWFIELKQKDNVVRKSETFEGYNKVLFPDLEPGSYEVWLTEDLNENNSWDTGIYNSKQPELVYRMSQSIKVRANWDIKETFIPN